MHRIEGALTKARAALELAPQFPEALSYLGATLVARAGRYEEGLTILEQAVAAAEDDATIHYTMGWNYEFVAYRVSRRPQRGLDSDQLFRKAESSLRRCLELEPEVKIKEDAQDLLSSIIREDVT